MLQLAAAHGPVLGMSSLANGTRLCSELLLGKGCQAWTPLDMVERSCKSQVSHQYSVLWTGPFSVYVLPKLQDHFFPSVSVWNRSLEAPERRHWESIFYFLFCDTYSSWNTSSKLLLTTTPQHKQTGSNCTSLARIPIGRNEHNFLALVTLFWFRPAKGLTQETKKPHKSGNFCSRRDAC